MIDDGKLLEANTTFSMVFQNALTERSESNWATEICADFQSTGARTKYPMSGTLPRMREWVGPRIFEKLSRFAYELKNRKFEQSEVVDVDDFNDDQLSGYEPLIAEMGYQAAEYKNDILLEAIAAGESEKCFDNLPYFHGAHPVEDTGNTFSNLFTGMPLTAENFDIVLTAMSTIKGKDGRAMGFRGASLPVLIVPPQLETIAKTIVALPTVSTGGANVHNGRAKILKISDLGVLGGTHSTSWYLADTSRALKPFIRQDREAVTFRMPKPDDIAVIEQNELRYMTKARGAAGYGIPSLCAKVKA